MLLWTQRCAPHRRVRSRLLRLRMAARTHPHGLPVAVARLCLDAGRTGLAARFTRRHLWLDAAHAALRRCARGDRRWQCSAGAALCAGAGRRACSSAWSGAGARSALRRAPVDPPGAQPIVRVADSGLSQAEKWRYRPDQEWRVLQRYLDASGAPDESRATIVIWPEGAIPMRQLLHARQSGLHGRARPRARRSRARHRDPQRACDAFMRGRRRRRYLYNSAAVIDGVSGAAALEPDLRQASPGAVRRVHSVLVAGQQPQHRAVAAHWRGLRSRASRRRASSFPERRRRSC